MGFISVEKGKKKKFRVFVLNLNKYQHVFVSIREVDCFVLKPRLPTFGWDWANAVI